VCSSNTNTNNIASAIAQPDAVEDEMSATTTSSYRQGVHFTTTAEKTDFTFGTPPTNNTSTGKVSCNHYQGPTVKPGCLKPISSLKKAVTSPEFMTVSISPTHNNKSSITVFVGKETSKPHSVSPPQGSNEGHTTLYVKAYLLAEEQDI
jgi:hypothetical protein